MQYLERGDPACQPNLFALECCPNQDHGEVSLGKLAEDIRSAVLAERYVFGVHADERLRERRILGWQVVAGVDAAKAILERPDSTPNAVVEFEQVLPDGTPFKAVWAWLPLDQTAKLVTVHFFDR